MRYVALLRGINVGGNKQVPMAQLRAMASELGFTNVATLLQSGNLLFDGKAQPEKRLEALLEAGTKESIGVECSYLIRTASEWEKIVAANPYARQAGIDPARVAVTVCRAAPAATSLEWLRGEAKDGEEFDVIGRELFAWYPNGLGQSKLAQALSKNRLGTVCTARNWNTVLKILGAAR